MTEFYHNGHLWKLLEQGRGYYLDLSESLEYDVTVAPKNGQFWVHIGVMFNGYEDGKVLLSLGNFESEDDAFVKAEFFAFLIMRHSLGKYDYWKRVSEVKEVLTCTLSNGKTRMYSMTRDKALVYVAWWDFEEGMSMDEEIRKHDDRVLSFSSRNDAKRHVMTLLKQFRIIGDDTFDELENITEESLLY